MSGNRSRWRRHLGPVSAALVLAACTAPPPERPAPEPVRPCAGMQPDAALAGKWLAVRKHKGVAGELHVLFTLRPDGTMEYAEQLRRGAAPPRTLQETGCWGLEDRTLVLQTLDSNGEPVEADDPIYRNRYSIMDAGASELRLQDADGLLRARRMGSSYQLPH